MLHTAVHFSQVVEQSQAFRISVARHCSSGLRLDPPNPLVRRPQEVRSVPSVAILMSDGMPALLCCTHEPGEKGGGEGGGGEGLASIGGGADGGGNNGGDTAMATKASAADHSS